MAHFSDYLENKVLDAVFNGTAWTTINNVWVGLYSAAPTDAGGGTELTGNGYARVSTAPADWTAASGGALSNGNAITFPTATGTWSVAAFGIFDASTAGNLLAWNTLTKTVDNGDTASFAVGDLDVSLD